MCEIIKLILCLVFVSGASSIEHVESELSQLPKLFHLDDYEECLDRTDGVFCMGRFQVYSDVEDNPTFTLIQKYALDADVYNRSYIHRGYCLTKRCPGGDSNFSGRFEACVDKWARYRHGLRARLVVLNYCKEHGKPLPSTQEAQDTPHRLFLYVVWTLLALNIIGTLYDINVEKKGTEDGLLRMWSVRSNWHGLTKPPDPSADNRMASLNGVKALMIPGPMVVHVFINVSAMFVRNPRFLEKLLLSGVGSVLGASTTLTQFHLVISNFITSYSLLSTPDVSFKSLPKLLLKRLIRMLPVYALVVGFAASWWPEFVEGPYGFKAADESSACRRKFWPTVFFLQNMFEPRSVCLIQTWILAVDMQFHIPVLVLTLVLMKCRQWALTILSAMFVGAVALTAHLAFENHYVPLYHFMFTQQFADFFALNHSFYDFFIMPANCLIAAVVAVWAAFYHKSLQERGPKKVERESLSYVFYTTFISMIVWMYLCISFKEFSDPWVIAAMVPVERVVFGVLMGMLVLFILNLDNCRMIDFLRWNNLRVFARMSLSSAMVHWCINLILLGNRQTLIDASVTGIIVDSIVVVVFSCILAFPLTIMVDLPMKRTLGKIVNKLP